MSVPVSGCNCSQCTEHRLRSELEEKERALTAANERALKWEREALEHGRVMGKRVAEANERAEKAEGEIAQLPEVLFVRHIEDHLRHSGESVVVCKICGESLLNISEHCRASRSKGEGL